MALPSYSFQHSILVIDDHHGFERLIREGLFSCAALFEFCPSIADEAIATLKREKPDLVMITHDFQTGSVQDFVEQSVDILQQMPCIFMGVLSEWSEEVSTLRNAQVLERTQLTAHLAHRFEQMRVDERQRRIGQATSPFPYKS